MDELLKARLLRSVVRVPGGCWIWTASKVHNGYGKLSIRGKWKLAHRVSYELHVGAIPEGTELDHLCRVRSCVNPDHLEPVTHVENVRRGKSGPRTHCKQGHPYDAENTYVNPAGKRYCRACGRRYTAAYMARKKARV